MADYFSRREVLQFLISEASRIESDSGKGCLEAVWKKFSGGAFDQHDDRPFLEFERACDFYGYGPMLNKNGRYVMLNDNVEGVAQ